MSPILIKSHHMGLGLSGLLLLLATLGVYASEHLVRSHTLYVALFCHLFNVREYDEDNGFIWRKS